MPSITYRYEIPHCSVCDDARFGVKDNVEDVDVRCIICGTLSDQYVDLVEKDDMYKLYLGAKAAGWLKTEDK